MEDPLIALGHAMARFTELTMGAEGDEPVPACADWRVADLVAHLGNVHRWAAATVLSGQRIADEPASRPTEPLEEWYAGIATALLAALQAVDGDEPTPNFAQIDEVAAFWSRRQLHETTIHAVDLAQALGRPEYGWGITDDVAADGVSELLRVFLRRMVARGRPPVVRGPIDLVATDIDRVWTLVPGENPLQPPMIVSSEADAVGVARGTVSELYLALWNRLPSDRLDLTGAAVDFFAGPRVP
ncbi:maleylpyruvate isomerase family mycothiol-dependent enzyme [Aeromicrobium phragmitis]|nr:maleylpyruvate isomerase family mycothiol-dependent enzyme [Aeromicrobium phragmitis]